MRVQLRHFARQNRECRQLHQFYRSPGSRLRNRLRSSTGFCSADGGFCFFPSLFSGNENFSCFRPARISFFYTDHLRQPENRRHRAVFRFFRNGQKFSLLFTWRFLQPVVPERSGWNDPPSALALALWADRWRSFKQEAENRNHGRDGKTGPFIREFDWKLGAPGVQDLRLNPGFVNIIKSFNPADIPGRTLFIAKIPVTQGFDIPSLQKAIQHSGGCVV